MCKNNHRAGRRITLAAVLMTLVLLLTCVADAAAAGRRLQGDVLRLHIVANSDAGEDQTVKLQVRDALLTQAADLFDGSVGAKEAEARLRPALGRLQKTASDTLEAGGFSYGAHVTLTTEYFPTRQYGDLTLPAGRYLALRVVLGDGAGQNWWCVMFPPLCLPAAAGARAEDYFDPDELTLLRPEGGYAVRFKLAEWALWLWDKLGG